MVEKNNIFYLTVVNVFGEISNRLWKIKFKVYFNAKIELKVYFSA